MPAETSEHSELPVALPGEEISPGAAALIAAGASDQPGPTEGSYMAKMMARLEQIRTMPLDQAGIAELTEKQLQRLRAVKLRSELRGE